MPGLYIIEQITQETLSIWSLWGILAFIIGMFFAFLFWYLAMDSWDTIQNIWFSLLMISCVIMIFGPIICFSKVPTYSAYKAIITPEINQEQFYKKYEIIDKENDLYIIKEIDYK